MYTLLSHSALRTELAGTMSHTQAEKIDRDTRRWPRVNYLGSVEAFQVVSVTQRKQHWPGIAPNANTTHFQVVSVSIQIYSQCRRSCMKFVHAV